MDMCDIDWDLWIKGLSLLIGVITLIKILIEYSSAKKWKRAEFLAKEYSEFINSVYVQASIQMLDGFEIPLLVTNKDGSSFTINYKDGKIVKALVLDSNSLYNKEQESIYIRLCIDKFLFKLGIFQNHITNKLISKNAVDLYLSYWIDLIGRNDSKLDSDTRTVLCNYIKRHGFNSVLTLLKEHGYVI